MAGGCRVFSPGIVPEKVADGLLFLVIVIGIWGLYCDFTAKWQSEHKTLVDTAKRTSVHTLEILEDCAVLPFLNPFDTWEDVPVSGNDVQLTRSLDHFRQAKEIRKHRLEQVDKRELRELIAFETKTGKSKRKVFKPSASLKQAILDAAIATAIRQIAYGNFQQVKMALIGVLSGRFGIEEGQRLVNENTEQIPVPATPDETLSGPLSEYHSPKMTQG